MIKSERYTSSKLNKEKLNKLIQTDDEVKNLKNEMSKFCYENLFDLLSDSKFVNNYKLFKSENLSAWEVQTIFKDIIIFYNNYFKVKIRNLSFLTQKEMKIEYYKKNTKVHKKGEVKSFEIVFNKISNLGKLIKYLCFTKDFNIKNEEVKHLYDYYKSKGFEERIKSLILSVQRRIRKKMKVIQFTTGTYRKLYGINKDKFGKTIQENGFIEDNTNSLYQVWFKHKSRKEIIYLPIQINSDYHNLSNTEKSQFFIKRNGNKFDFIALKEVENPDFKDFNKVIGIDLNIKHNFIVTSDGIEYDYERKYIKEFVKELKKLDKIGSKNFSEKQKKRLEKLVKKNEWYFKKLIHDILDEFERNGITDIVMEDLDKFSKTFVKSEEFEIKYSRLTRLLRLGNIKVWFNSQAEKRGIRVHITSPRYTSQTCPKCGNVDKNNRKSQEEFECTECGYKQNADFNASVNIKNRYTLDVLKFKLHNFDEFQRLIPKKLGKNKIKQILENYST